MLCGAADKRIAEVCRDGDAEFFHGIDGSLSMQRFTVDNYAVHIK